jgi:methionyl-tRNA formyltransferase
MRIGFAGTPDFAATALAGILDAGFSVVLVLTQPDRPRGRGMKREGGAVKTLAIGRGLAVRQPASLKEEREREPLVAVPIDVLVVAAYGLILPRRALCWPRHGCINIHASLLPRWRGAAPIQRAILEGDHESGISIMRMDEGLDTGPVLSRHPVAIDERDTAGTLHDKLAIVGARAIVETLRALERQELPEGVPQDDSIATYAGKIGRDEAEIDWTRDARSLDRQVRAFDPVPGAQTVFEGAVLKIWRASPAQNAVGPPGTVIRADASGIVVASGDGALVVSELQRGGGRRMDARAFVAGHRIAPGAQLGAHSS